MPIKRKKKKLTAKKIQKGNIGNFSVYAILALLIIVGITAVGGLPSRSSPQDGTVVNIVTPTPDSAHSSLQLNTFGYTTNTPSLPASDLCHSRFNTEKGILIGYSPAPGQSVSATGQIKVWVTDENAPFIAPDEIVNLSTGQIITPGVRTAKAKDSFLYEPALYIAPQTAETNVNAGHFPDLIKGEFNNTPLTHKTIVTGAPIDPLPSGSKKTDKYTAEYVWNVSALGLTTGTYQTEFVIHDGDSDRGIGCIPIQIQ